MNHLEGQKAQKYLSELVENSDIVLLSTLGMDYFRGELENCLSVMPVPIIEYVRSPRDSDQWKVSERSPLSFYRAELFKNNVNKNTVHLCFNTKPDWQSGGFKYFNLDDQVAFLSNGGLYLAISNNAGIFHEDIYLPEKLVREIM